MDVSQVNCLVTLPRDHEIRFGSRNRAPAASVKVNLPKEGDWTTKLEVLCWLVPESRAKQESVEDICGEEVQLLRREIEQTSAGVTYFRIPFDKKTLKRYFDSEKYLIRAEILSDNKKIAESSSLSFVPNSWKKIRNRQRCLDSLQVRQRRGRLNHVCVEVTYKIGNNEFKIKSHSWV